MSYRELLFEWPLDILILYSGVCLLSLNKEAVACCLTFWSAWQIRRGCERADFRRSFGLGRKVAAKPVLRGALRGKNNSDIFERMGEGLRLPRRKFGLLGVRGGPPRGRRPSTFGRGSVHRAPSSLGKTRSFEVERAELRLPAPPSGCLTERVRNCCYGGHAAQRPNRRRRKAHP